MLSQDVERFIRDFIKSVWHLELLLLLRRDPSRRWSEENLVLELRSSMLIVADALKELDRAALLARGEDGTHYYAPATPQLDELVQRIEVAYASSPMLVTHTIWSAPSLKIQIFADAFRLKKD